MAFWELGRTPIQYRLLNGVLRYLTKPMLEETLMLDNWPSKDSTTTGRDFSSQQVRRGGSVVVNQLRNSPSVSQTFSLSSWPFQ